MARYLDNEAFSPDKYELDDVDYERPTDPAHEARLDQLTAAEEWAERVCQENTGTPWADGPDRTYEQMERDDAEFAARQARRDQGEVEAEAQPIEPEVEP